MYNRNFKLDIKDTHIVSYALGDVNSDRIPDNLYLTVIKTESSPFIFKT